MLVGHARKVLEFFVAVVKALVEVDLKSAQFAASQANGAKSNKVKPFGLGYLWKHRVA